MYSSAGGGTRVGVMACLRTNGISERTRFVCWRSVEGCRSSASIPRSASGRRGIESGSGPWGSIGLRTSTGVAVAIAWPRKFWPSTSQTEPEWWRGPRADGSALLSRTGRRRRTRPYQRAVRTWCPRHVPDTSSGVIPEFPEKWCQSYRNPQPSLKNGLHACLCLPELPRLPQAT